MRGFDLAYPTRDPLASVPVILPSLPGIGSADLAGPRRLYADLPDGAIPGWDCAWTDLGGEG